VIHVGGTVHVAGCSADLGHGAFRVIEVEVIATAGSAGPTGRSRGMLWRQRLDPVTHLGGTSELMTQVYDA